MITIEDIECLAIGDGTSTGEPLIYMCLRQYRSGNVDYVQALQQMVVSLAAQLKRTEQGFKIHIERCSRPFTMPVGGE